jgi:hypothetical protein
MLQLQCADLLALLSLRIKIEVDLSCFFTYSIKLGTGICRNEEIQKMCIFSVCKYLKAFI